MCTNTHLKNQEHFSFLGFKRSVLENVIKTIVCIVELGMLLQNTQGLAAWALLGVLILPL